MKYATQRINTLIESLPYIQKFAGKNFVIKFGGSIIKTPAAIDAFVEDVVLMSLIGIKPVIVHGGGSDITQKLEQLKIPTSFINGLRVTDEKAIKEVEMILSGSINKELVMRLQNAGAKSIGISGKDGGLLKAKKLYSQIEGEPLDIGYVGEVETIQIQVVKDLIDLNYIPVIAPIGFDEKGNTYNINADTAAGAISGCLKSEKLILLTDVDGLYLDFNDKTTLTTELTQREANHLIKTDQIKGGMRPKLECALNALESGVNSVHLVNGTREHGLLLEIFTKEGVGTMIKKEGK